MLLMAKSTKNSSPTISAEFDTPEYEVEFYTVYCRQKENSTDNMAKGWFLDHIKNSNKNAEEYSFLLPRKYSPYGIYSKLLSDGIRLPTYAETSLDEFIKKIDNINKDKLAKREHTKHEKNKRADCHLRRFLGDLNSFVDKQLETVLLNKKPNTDISNILSLYDVSPLFHSESKDMMQPSIRNIELAINKKDEQLVEAYSFMTKKQMIAYLECLTSILQRVPMVSTISSAKPPRKIKIKKPEQLVKRLVIQDSCLISGLSSCGKTDIIDSNLIYVYNTKTRFLIRYVTTSKFSIKGATLLNVQEEESCKKKIRKPTTIFAAVNSKNRRYMDKLWDSIKCKKSPTKNRLHKTSILISCFKDNSI